MKTVDNATPIPILQIVPSNPSLDAPHQGPISVDEFLDSDLEFNDDNHKEYVSSASVATDSVETESAATESVSEEIQEEISFHEHSEGDYDSSKDHADPIDCGTSEDNPNKRDLADIVESDSSEAPYVVESDTSEAPYECDSIVDSIGVCINENNKRGSNGTDITENLYGDKNDAVLETNDGYNYIDYPSSSIEGREIEPGVEAQEWTYEEHVSRDASKERQRQLDREQRRNERFERAERRRLSKFVWFGSFLLLLEVAGASIAVKNYQELHECCGRSIFSENESVGERWNKAFFLLGILYISFIIVIEIPTLIIAQETIFLFNPMVGYLLAMHMLYTTDIESAYIIFGIETVAMLGQSMVLVQMQRSPESCVHSLLNYTLSGITIYMMITLTQQGGYCIVNDRIQSIFAESTCNTACIDEATCFRCGDDDDPTLFSQCFIRFPES